LQNIFQSHFSDRNEQSNEDVFQDFLKNRDDIVIITTNHTTTEVNVAICSNHLDAQQDVEKIKADGNNPFCLEIINCCFINGKKIEKQVQHNIKIGKISFEIMANIIGNTRDYNNQRDNPSQHGNVSNDYKKEDKNGNDIEKNSNNGLNKNDVQEIINIL